MSADVNGHGHYVMQLLDSSINYHRKRRRIITGIVISTALKERLKNVCCDVLKVKGNPQDLDIQRFMGIPIIETSDTKNRCEVIWKSG